MNDVWKLYDYVVYILRQKQTGAKLSPSEFNILLEVANWVFFKTKYGIPEEYQIGMPFSKQMYEWTQNNIDSMDRFKVIRGWDTMPLSIDSIGKALIPSNYMHVSSFAYKNITNDECGYSSSMRLVEILTDAEWNDRVSNPINPPSFKYPICRFFSGKIQFLPTNLKRVEFVYLRKPTTPSLAYTYDNTIDEVVRDTTNSVNLEWDEQDCIDIASIIIERAAASSREPFMVQYGNKMKVEGK